MIEDGCRGVHQITMRCGTLPVREALTSSCDSILDKGLVRHSVLGLHLTTTRLSTDD